MTDRSSHLLNHGVRSTSFSSTPSAGADVFISDDDDDNSSSIPLEEGWLKKEEVDILKQNFEEEKQMLVLEAAKKHGVAVQEWMKELVEKERLKKEGEMERM